MKKSRYHLFHYFTILAVGCCISSTTCSQSIGKLSATENATNAMQGALAYISAFTRPPMPMPRWQQLDAPLHGNGDMGVAIGGEPENQQFWLSKNDLWELRHVWCKNGPRPLGRISINIPYLQGATYQIEQSLIDATTISSFKKDGNEVNMRTWVSATENLLVVELIAKGRPVEGDVQLWIPSVVSPITRGDHRPVPGFAAEALQVPPAPVFGDGAGIFWGIRGFREDVEIPAEVVCVFRLLNGKEQHFKLKSGKPGISFCSYSEFATEQDV